MAILNITAKRSNDTVTPPSASEINISSQEASRCTDPLVYRAVDSIAYHDGTSFTIGVTVYSDSGLTTLKNTTGLQKDYNTPKGIFITLDENSVYIKSNC